MEISPKRQQFYLGNTITQQNTMHFPGRLNVEDRTAEEIPRLTPGIETSREVAEKINTPSFRGTPRAEESLFS
jgi:hypothetical protein